MMAIVLTLGREVMRIICAHGPQSGRPDTEIVRFYDEMASEWDFGSSSEIIVSLGDFNGYVGKGAKGCESNSVETSAQAGGHRSGKKVLKKIVRKKRIIRKIWKLNENRTRIRFEKRV